MMGLRAHLAAALFASVAIGCGSDEDGGAAPSGPLDTTGAKPGQIYVVGGVRGDTTPAWAPNHPACHGGHYWEYENGAYGSTGQGANAWVNAGVGAGAARAALTGEPGWFQNACSYSTGTTTTGSYTSLKQIGMICSAVSGIISYQATVSLPVASDGTDTYYLQVGLANTVSAILSSAGCFVRYTHSVNGGKFELVVASNNVKTVVDTGVTMVAGAYYDIRCAILNNTNAYCWIKQVAVSAVDTWVDDGVWGAPTATSSTNVPNGSSTDKVTGLTGILKSAGTTARLVKLGFQLMDRVPNFTPSGGIVAGTGLQAGDVSTGIGVDPSGAASWSTPLKPRTRLGFQAYGPGGWIPTSSAAFSAADVGGTGGTGSISSPGTVLNPNLFGMSNLNCGNTATDGYAFYRTSYSLNLDATVQPLIIEGVFSIPTLSTGAQAFKLTQGIFNQASSVLTYGVSIEVDNNASANAQCVTTNNGVATTVDSGVAIVAATEYFFRITVTSTSCSFWVVKNNVTTLPVTPHATVSTNIPSGATMAAGMGVRKSAGTTSRNAQFGYVFAEQWN